MNGNTGTKDKRRTTMVPVTTMEEIPVLTDAEKTELHASLKEAEAQIEAGNYTEYDARTFRERFMDIFRGAKR
jgi:hypothetical protein